MTVVSGKGVMCEGGVVMCMVMCMSSVLLMGVRETMTLAPIITVKHRKQAVFERHDAQDALQV